MQLDEGFRIVGCCANKVRYTLTQLRLGSELPSLLNPLPHGRGNSSLLRITRQQIRYQQGGALCSLAQATQVHFFLDGVRAGAGDA